MESGRSLTWHASGEQVEQIGLVRVPPDVGQVLARLSARCLPTDTQ